MIKYNEQGAGAADLTNLPEAPKLSQKQLSQLKSWRSEVETAEERQRKPFIDPARKVVDIYEATKRERNSFNILFSNTETMLPAIFSAVPKPVVRRRYNDDDPLGKAASQVIQRTLQFLLNTGSPAYPTFFDSVQQDVVNALVPGRGISWVCYTAGIETIIPPTESAQASTDDAEGSMVADDTEAAKQPEENAREVNGSQEKVNFETVYLETVPWDRFIHGYGRAWGAVPWVGRIHFLTRQELFENFGPLGNLVKLTHQGDRPDGDKDDNTRNAKDVKFAKVYEVWDRKSRRMMCFTCQEEFFLKNESDPLKLEGFFPCPKPLQFIKQVSGIIPKPLYLMYEEQAKELNAVSSRINKIIAALKVRGFYDATLEGLDRLMESDDNTLLPMENVAQVYGQNGSLEKSLFMMPLNELVTVLQQLYVQRVQCKQVIYEITGLNDILRGSSVASETATAQDLKDKWGSLRLKNMQGDTETYILSLLRIMAEVAIQMFSPETFAAMTQLKFPREEEKQQAQMVMQQMQTQAAQQAQMAQMQGGQPQPPAPPPPELLQVLESPSWEEILALLADDLARNFAISIETSSSIMDDAQSDKADVAEFMNAISQFLNGVAPMIADGTLPFEAAKAMLLAVTKRFNFGQEVEEQLAKMTAPAPKEDPKAAGEKAKLETAQQIAQIDMGTKQAEAELKKQELAGKAQLMQVELQIAMQELEIKKEELQIKREEMMMKREQAQFDMAMSQQKAAVDTQIAEAGQQQQVRQMEIDGEAAERDAEYAAQAAEQKAAAAGEGDE